MFAHLVRKELRLILTSPKFLATFLTCLVLILLTVYTGIREYQREVAEYENGVRLNDQVLRERTTYSGLINRVYRRPDPMHIFAFGVNYDIGRLARISSLMPVKLSDSAFQDEPLFALFRFVDFNFVVVTLLSLFAIVFTYDAVNGERERGLLKLTFANAVPRSTFILAKLVGSWLGLIVPVVLAIVLSLLLVIVSGVPMRGGDWLRVIVLMGFVVLYLSFFILLGIAVSALTRRSIQSFIGLLVCWIVLVLVIPRLGIATAAHIVDVPTVSEIESQIESVGKELWRDHEDYLRRAWEKRNAEMTGMDAEQRGAYQDEHQWEWAEEDTKERNTIEQKLAETSARLKEDMENRKTEQARLGFLLSRFSPASCLSLAAMQIAATDIGIKSRYERELSVYKENLVRFVNQKRQSEGGGGLRIEFNSDRGLRVSTPDLKKTIDVSEIPVFQMTEASTGQWLTSVVPDGLIILSWSVVMLLTALFAFLRYDVR